MPVTVPALKLAQAFCVMKDTEQYHHEQEPTMKLAQDNCVMKDTETSRTSAYPEAGSSLPGSHGFIEASQYLPCQYYEL